jgi:hypothetical protein
MISGRGSVMDNRFVLLVSGQLALLLVTPAHAGGDFGYTVDWKLVNPAGTGCANIPALGASNDTRVNLLLLLLDRHGTPPGQAPLAAQSIPIDWSDFRDRIFPATANDSADYADGEGSRCHSNESGATRFEVALEASPELPPDGRATLLAARKALSPTCANKSAPVDDAVHQHHSVPGQAFAPYLRGAAALYDGQFTCGQWFFAT